MVVTTEDLFKKKKSKLFAKTVKRNPQQVSELSERSTLCLTLHLLPDISIVFFFN